MEQPTIWQELLQNNFLPEFVGILAGAIFVGVGIKMRWAEWKVALCGAVAIIMLIILFVVLSHQHLSFHGMVVRAMPSVAIIAWMSAAAYFRHTLRRDVQKTMDKLVDENAKTMDKLEALEIRLRDEVTGQMDGVRNENAKTMDKLIAAEARFDHVRDSTIPQLRVEIVSHIDNSKDDLINHVNGLVEKRAQELIDYLTTASKLMTEQIEKVVYSKTVKLDDETLPQEKNLHSITPKQISDDLETTDPLHRLQHARNYLGMYVKWQCTLLSKERESDLLCLSFLPLRSDMLETIYVKVKEHDHPGLALTKLESPITLTGRVLRIGIEPIRYFLDDVKIEVETWPDDNQHDSTELSTEISSYMDLRDMNFNNAAARHRLGKKP